MGSLGQSTTMKTFLIFSACLLTIIIAQRSIFAQNDPFRRLRKFSVRNELADKINVTMVMIPDSCASGSVGFNDIPGSGGMVDGDPQRSCNVKSLKAVFSKSKNSACAVKAAGLNCRSRFVVKFLPPPSRNPCQIACDDGKIRNR